jgi:transposase-like protein
MRADKEKAIKLRLRGNSYSQIQKKLGEISKSTLSLWLKNVSLSDKSRAKIENRIYKKATTALIKRNKAQSHIARKKAKETRKKYSSKIKRLSFENLELIGLALYWAEGYKKPIIRNGREVSSHPISFTNSDPEMIKIFLRFIREIFQVQENRIRANLRIFKHMDEESAINFWTKKTSLPKENFSKTFVSKHPLSTSRRPFNRLPFGVIQIRINDTQLFHKVMGSIEGIKKQV